MEEKRVKRDRIEITKEIIRMAKDGKAGAPVIDYLKSLGYNNPVQAWQDIKKYVKVKAPELYAQLPVRVNGKMTTMGQVEVADKLPKTIPEAEVKLPEAEEPKKRSFAEMKKPDDARILGQEPLEVASVYSRVVKNAEYTRCDGGTMWLRKGNAHDGILLTAYEWFKLTEEILVALRQLDVCNPSRTLEPEEYTGNNGPLK